MAVKEEVRIYSERIDDIPVKVEWLKQMEIAKCIDQKLKEPHGNYEGMSYGQLSVLLLTYIITQSARRLSAVEPWVVAHRRILELSTGWSIGEKDTTDDRLGRVVEELAVGKGFEVELGKFWFNQETNKWVRWHERYLVVYSQSLAASAIRGQQQRLLSARTALDKLANKLGC